MTDEEIYAGLQEVFDAVFKRRDIPLTPQLSAADVPGWDSFKQVDLLMGVEERFHISFDGDNVDSLETIGDLAQAVRQHVV